ncbi:hydrogenase maturation protein HypF [Streptomyces abyssalis]|uniref:Carbamoyltransferase n=1 Tax=Streptomyces abyssalis TaxID=933944 RepID=A0A1E7JUU3_9ACTN|nr:carbamoyltransferase HypF [Streptomyces abyssalis]OEU89343.1 hydrogenase maturation protein HypF [Streptomyces abyssalis]OEU93684.1 hydrogenase maturation protein HypF [Streptomyces abyssalis]
MNPQQGTATAARNGTEHTHPAQRRRVTVRGVVQGVGFRPFVYALAGELGLSGHVANTGDGVVAEVEGGSEALTAFCGRISTDAPPLAVVQSVTHEPMTPAGGRGFTIAESRGRGGTARTLVAPDTATCADCLAEMSDPADRRHRHPFITCTHCGPRFTIVTGLPYDRSHTTMNGFPMCERCAQEYSDPGDRRFHAQPVSCHDCGPRLRLHVPAGARGAGGSPDGEPVAAARRLLAEGAIVAVKGIGGYHLACDASNAGAVSLLRRRKARGDKPFALMARDLEDAARLVHLDAVARELLTGGRRPIVLLRRRAYGTGPAGQAPAVAGEVAPRSADLGIMLPYSPLHHLLLGLPGDPPGPRLLVMTSGNFGGEPIVTSDEEALERLAPLADAWLTHDRPIHVPCDDSVVRVTDGEQLPVRRSRGYAPFPVNLPVPVTAGLAVGGDLKNTFCAGEGHHAWLSAHIGDMDDLATLNAFDGAERQLEAITGVRPALLAADRHPGYRSAGWAERNADGRPVHRVQHHHAHIASVMAEHGLDGSAPVIGVAFDGTGYGDDATVWGGEFLLADYDGYRRLAHLSPVPLPGGDAAVRRPYRMALAHLHAAGLPWDADLPCTAACPEDELKALAVQLERNLGCVPTSSMGRLFDAAASLAGVCHHAGYEAQAAMEFEAAAAGHGDEPERRDWAFTLRTTAAETLTCDPAPVLAGIAADVRAGVPAGSTAARFHRSVAALVLRVCRIARERHRLGTVALSGGVFTNSLLSAACARLLNEDGFTVLRHRLVPPNDGGLALGQLMVAARAETAPPPRRRTVR